MKRVLAFVGIVVLMTSVAAADLNPSKEVVLNPEGSWDRVNGTLGSVTITANQYGPLQVALEASATTVGGDGVPVTVTFNTNTYQLNNQIWVYGQIYDSPWNGGCTFWTTSPGTDWCAYGEQYFINSPNPMGSFNVSFTTTVPVAMDYQTFVVARGGLTWITTGYDWFNFSQTVAHSVVETLYIGSTIFPTPTPNTVPGNPVPTINRYGVIAMVVLLLGVAVLVLSRRH